MADSEHNRFEKARIIGSRALQIAMGAPIVIEVPSMLDPVALAEAEYREGLIPVTVQKRDEARPMRKRPAHVARPRKVAQR